MGTIPFLLEAFALAICFNACLSQNITSYAKTCSDCHSTNADCNLKQGYVMCSCKSGFIGNGLNCTLVVYCGTTECCSPGYTWDNTKTLCVDNNECLNSLLHTCLKPSECRNMIGLYLCNSVPNPTCPAEVCSTDKDCIRDGTILKCVDPCENYQEIDGSLRLYTLNSVGRFDTDRYLFGWYRYKNGMRLREGYVGPLKCGSVEPYSLSSHPTVSEGVKSVALLRNGLTSNLIGPSILVKACAAGYYVYKFTGLVKSEVYCSDYPSTTTSITTTTTTTTTPTTTTTTTTTPKTTTATTTTTPMTTTTATTATLTTSTSTAATTTPTTTLTATTTTPTTTAPITTTTTQMTITPTTATTSPTITSTPTTVTLTTTPTTATTTPTSTTATIIPSSSTTLMTTSTTATPGTTIIPTSNTETTEPPTTETTTQQPSTMNTTETTTEHPSTNFTTPTITTEPPSTEIKTEPPTSTATNTTLKTITTTPFPSSSTTLTGTTIQTTPSGTTTASCKNKTAQSTVLPTTHSPIEENITVTTVQSKSILKVRILTQLVNNKEVKSLEINETTTVNIEMRTISSSKIYIKTTKSITPSSILIHVGSDGAHTLTNVTDTVITTTENTVPNINNCNPDTYCSRPAKTNTVTDTSAIAGNTCSKVTSATTSITITTTEEVIVLGPHRFSKSCGYD